MHKNYILFLHWKQGDDLAGHIAKTKTIPDALRRWSSNFKKIQEICEQIAAALEGKKVNVSADTHLISFQAEDRAAKKTLETLAKKGFFSVEDDCDCVKCGGDYVPNADRVE